MLLIESFFKHVTPPMHHKAFIVLVSPSNVWTALLIKNFREKYNFLKEDPSDPGDIYMD